jgi:hypothetical protein
LSDLPIFFMIFVVFFIASVIACVLAMDCANTNKPANGRDQACMTSAQQRVAHACFTSPSFDSVTVQVWPTHGHLQRN